MQIWIDDKTVNVIASCCLSKQHKVMVAAVKFFLNEEAEDSDSDSDEEEEEEQKPHGPKAASMHR